MSGEHLFKQTLMGLLMTGMTLLGLAINKEALEWKRQLILPLRCRLGLSMVATGLFLFGCQKK